jgi:hypothetical protein
MEHRGDTDAMNDINASQVCTDARNLPPAENAAAPESAADNRDRPDRRQKPTSPWDAFRFAGRRTRNRRAVEHKLPYFVDRFLPIILALVLMLLIATIADAILTIRLLDAGGSEANPIMGCLLNYGVQPFLLGKYLLTVVGLPLLLIYQHHYLFGTRVRVGYMIPFTLALYAVLIGYQIVLIQKYAPW